MGRICLESVRCSSMRLSSCWGHSLDSAPHPWVLGRQSCVLEAHIAPVRNGLVIRSLPMLGARPWPQMETDVVAKRQQLVDDRLDQRVVVAAGNVAAPDRAAEQHVADMGETHFLVEVHHAARRMAGGNAGCRRSVHQSRTSSPSSSQRSGAKSRTPVMSKTRAARDHIVEQEFVGEVAGPRSALQRVAQTRRRRRHGRYGRGGSARSFRRETLACSIAA